ncbi:hypothetical protein KCP70_08190 [Salmonella enterica subsp. enterica]|nr:hypothetical protein KCP70_08190 [Salmonella enterica subsp. enterica]
MAQAMRGDIRPSSRAQPEELDALIVLAVLARRTSDTSRLAAAKCRWIGDVAALAKAMQRPASR